MEAKIGGKAHHLYGPVVSDVKAVGKKSVEWDLNDWKWDGDLFTAAPLNSLPSDCRSRQFFPVSPVIPPEIGVSNGASSGTDTLALGNENGRRELDKRRRVVVLEEDDLSNGAGSLNLKLGGQVFPITEVETERWEGKSGKKIKTVGPSSNRAVCQVEDCRADLSNAKDYHRRHKVCDVHSKAARALVGNVMQRFCQQCSRFHVLQEFDEGKRSCRRRLAGHNKRRRKTHPENVAVGASPNDEQANSSDQSKDQDLVSHLLRNLANLAGTVNEKNLTGLLPGSQDFQSAGKPIESPAKDLPSDERNAAAPAREVMQKRMLVDAQGVNLQNPSASESTLLFPTKLSISGNGVGTTTGRTNLNNIDLNNAYDDSQDCMENIQHTGATLNQGNLSPNFPLWLYQDPEKSSPPQTSGNSASMSSQSPSSSKGEAQSRTDRIVFKLFGKDPSDFPHVLRNQILDWLSHSPTDIESYIRPGCVVLTIYVRMDKSMWEELCCDLSSSLRRLLSASANSFWRTGWIYTRVRHRLAFIYNGQVVLDTSLPLNSYRSCRISSIKPLAVPFSEGVRFLVKGFNLSQSSTRLQCALEGKYLVRESCTEMIGETDSYTEHDRIQSVNLPCSIPDVIGRGFIEVEDHGLNGSFFPFIVAEKDVCSEICTLERVMEIGESVIGIQGGRESLEARGQALYFIHEMGWLLHRSQLKHRLGQSSVNFDLFPFERFRWLVEYSVDREWCAVVKKLLDTLFSGIVDAGPHASVELALLEIGLLHRAVLQNCRRIVEFLLGYCPDGVLKKRGPQQNQSSDRSCYLFRPDVTGPGGLTPLHIAASREDSENVLNALTDDPGKVGIEAWRSACDSTGLTPNDYASLRGYRSYIYLVQKKINKKSGSGHVVLDIPSSLSDNNIKQKSTGGSPPVKVASFQTERCCRQCERKLAYGSSRTSLAMYKPAMLSMVAIAAVCVCVALLFKSSPEVLYVFQPFRWELLEYGSI